MIRSRSAAGRCTDRLAKSGSPSSAQKQAERLNKKCTLAADDPKQLQMGDNGRQREATRGNGEAMGRQEEGHRFRKGYPRLPFSQEYIHIYITLTAELFREGFPVLSVLRFGKQILVREMPIPLLVLRRASFAELEI